MYINGTVKQYLDDLAAKKPAPGGGSAAALAASIGVSLMEMVANYTIGNSKYKNVEAKAADILVKAENMRSELLSLIDKDVEAYGKVSRMLKEDAKDPGKTDSAYKEAAQPPFEICRISSLALKLCRQLVECGNKNLVTDTAIVAIMLEGAFFAAKYNVYINLKYIKDMDYIGKLHNILQPLEEEMPALKEEILEKCEDIIAK